MVVSQNLPSERATYTKIYAIKTVTKISVSMSALFLFILLK